MAHLATGQPAPREWIEYTFASRFGWTLAYVRGLPLPDVMQLMVIMGAEQKANKK
jgi:hypothetical protein